MFSVSVRDHGSASEGSADISSCVDVEVLETIPLSQAFAEKKLHVTVPIFGRAYLDVYLPHAVICPDM